MLCVTALIALEVRDIERCAYGSAEGPGDKTRALCMDVGRLLRMRRFAHRRAPLGVVVANVDLPVGCAVLDPVWRALVVALVMAVLSPVMAEQGSAGGDSDTFNE